MNSLQSMGTWELCDLPPGRKAIPCKWVFKRKLTADGQIERYKARLVIKGFHQKHGIDYEMVFAPVVRADSIRLFFTMVAAFDLECHTIDIKNAFIQGILTEEIFMKQPSGYNDGSRRVCRLIKSLYGLKQAPRVWHETLRDHLVFLGCIQCLSDGALFLFQSKEHGLIIILMYVDDLQIAAAKLSSVNFMKKCILDKFPGSDKGETDYFLQMSVIRDRPNRNIILKQKRHIDDLVDELKLTNAHPRSVPMIEKVHSDSAGVPFTSADAITSYRRLIGILIHIAHYTRPDIAFAVGYLARFNQCPDSGKLARAVDIVRYLKGTSDMGLHLGGNTNVFGFSDASHADCNNSEPSSNGIRRQSTSGFVVQMGHGSISWRSSKQATVSTSTAEAEYIAAGEISREAQYIYQLSQQLLLQPTTIPIGIDNVSAIFMTEDPLSAKRTKHIDVAYHFVREKVKYGWVKMKSIRGTENPSDIFTKPLGRQLFAKHRDALGVRA